MVEGRDSEAGTPSGEIGFNHSVDSASDQASPLSSGKVVDLDVDPISNSSKTNNLVTARGTGDGLIIRLDGRVDADVIADALRDYIISRKDFLAGNDVVLEWVGKKPSEDAVKDVTEILSDDFNIVVSSSRMKAHRSLKTESDVNSSTFASDASLSLFDGIEALGDHNTGSLTKPVPPITSSASAAFGGQFSISDESSLWDEADARVISGTMRSGQKVESDHSVVILGDVNSGAEIVAGGDIVVLGKLRGVAHAGAYDETGGGRFIFALELQPTQLRIGTVISRGEAEGGSNPEIAKVDGNLIVVESYNSRSAMRRGGV
ncbi:MAG: septum site-determining protein MinC [Bdellovibrionota bacterium]